MGRSSIRFHSLDLWLIPVPDVSCHPFDASVSVTPLFSKPTKRHSGCIPSHSEMEEGQSCLKTQLKNKK
jgi:hypothetical protein